MLIGLRVIKRITLELAHITSTLLHVLKVSEYLMNGDYINLIIHYSENTFNNGAVINPEIMLNGTVSKTVLES